jgi:hypothetical protein
MEEGGTVVETSLFAMADEFTFAVSAFEPSAPQPPQIMAINVEIERRKFGIENPRDIKIYNPVER